METSVASNTQEQTQNQSDGSKDEPVICHCDKHGPWEATVIINPITGEKRHLLSCPKCEKEQERAEEECRWQKRIHSWLERAKFPVRHESFKFDDFTTQTKEQEFALKVARGYAEKFPEHFKVGRSLIFTGKPGTGKTSLACAIGRTIIEARSIHEESLLVRYVNLAFYSTEHSMLRDIKSTWKRNSEFTEEEIINLYTDVALLIVDEIGVGGHSDTDKALIHQVIDGRYGRIKPTLIVGNLTSEELNQHLGERIMDRLKEGGGVIVPFTWKSFRK